jgi:hypothetical protein
MLPHAFKHNTERHAGQKPLGTIGKKIGGHDFPPSGELSDAERITALEDAVRGLYEALSYVAASIERELGR